LSLAGTAAGYIKLCTAAIKHADNVSVLLRAHCAQLLFQRIEYLHGPSGSIASRLREAFHYAVTGIVEEDHSPLACITIVTNFQVMVAHQL